MLDVLNRYAHGLVLVPVVLACRRRGVLAALQAVPLQANELADRLRANSGHLQVTLRLFESLGWIYRDLDGRYTTTVSAQQERLIPDELWGLVDVDFDSYLQTGRGGLIGPWLEAVRTRWNCTDPLMADFLDGMLVVPLLTLLTKRGVLRELPRHDFNVLPPEVRTEVISLLRLLGWLEGSPGQFTLTAPGTFMFERAMNLGLAESYRPMLRSMDQLLFGYAASVFALDADGHERHVNRSMNVISSSFQYDRYLSEVEEILISIFSRQPFADQPRYVADMGCGDGTFLRRILTTVREKTPRGRALDEYPLTLVGIAPNNAALEETSRKLADLDHILITGDIGNPLKVVEDLRLAGVDHDQVLHIHAFLDHDRPFIAPVDQASLKGRASARYLGAYADRSGNIIEPATVVQGLVEHLKRWAGAINKHGFILLEVHCQDPRVVRANIDQSESLYFDAVGGFSQQLLVEADAALLSAAEAGLFPRPEYFMRFPRGSAASRITLNLFERQPFQARLATTSDIPALLHLEETCWSPRTRLPAGELERRINCYTPGQLVLEHHGRVVGVVYSQRINDIDSLRSCTFREVAGLHDENGNIVQLLALNVLPEVRHLGLADRLLDLMLMRSSLQSGVRQVTGVTRCRDFSGTSLDELVAYVRQRDAAGEPVDPVLQFHHSHGAELLGVLAEFRPEDVENLGAGVLLRYDLVAPGVVQPATSDLGRNQRATTEIADTKARLESCLRGLLGHKREDAFSWTRSLRDMGLDSLDLLGLRALLHKTFETSLSPTFFFSHPTPQRILSFFDQTSAGIDEPQSACAEPVRLAAQKSMPAESATPTEQADASAAAHLDAPPPAHAGASPANHAPAPIAIVGMACRFPGCADLEGFWNLLERGGSAVTGVPAQRWNMDELFSTERDVPGTIVSRHGGFLPHVDEFDASFFNISPREARLMDPQQRILLETHWEALEHAGIDPTRLRDAGCGIFVGLSSHDYELLQVETGTQEDLEAYYATGNSAAIAAGRLAYFLGTRGPALTLDTACSSSLVAVHQAVRSLRTRECDLALASGANLILSPRLSIAYSRAGMLSPDGRCKTFDARADGYVRSEGCGVVAMKRLDDAQRDGDLILAVLRGSAVNQDGASNGLTAPSLVAQEQLLLSALRDANLLPADVDYIEGHGTGTSLGDPVEFHALQSVFGADTSRSEPLWLGSVKTNIGHAEAAAGVAGLIKVVLSMQRHWLPAHLNFETPNPHIDLHSIPARIPLKGQSWRRTGRPLRAGVNSFGFSGTNAHVIVEQAPASPTSEGPARRRSMHVLALSAKSAPALQALVRRYEDWTTTYPQFDLEAVCHAANAGRAHHDHRLAMVAASRGELKQSLALSARRATRLARVEGAPKIAFLFTGQGSQYPGMARELYLEEPVFRAALKECSGILRDELNQTLEEILYPDAGQLSLLDDTGHTQPVLFAVEYALARMLHSWGIQPAVVMGHSVGEYVAACLAGVFSVEDGLKLIAARGRLMSALPRDGAMLAVRGRRDIVTRTLEQEGADLAVAAYNNPENTVISGRRAAIGRLQSTLAAAGVQSIPLQVSHAFHSPLMEPMLDAFMDVARKIQFSVPRVPFISNVTGNFATTEISNPEYWRHHIRQPVLFEEGIQSLLHSGAQVMLEIGPHPVLSAMGRKCLGAESGSLQWLHTLTRGASDWDGISKAVAALYEGGAEIDWSRLDAGHSRPRVSVPTYPWQRQRFWFETVDAKEARGQMHAATRRAPPMSTSAHGRRLHSPGSRAIHYENDFTSTSPALLNDHRLFGTVVVPGPVLLNMVLSAAADALRGEVAAIQEMVVQCALMLHDDSARTVHLQLMSPRDGTVGFEIHSAQIPAEQEPLWVLHARGTLVLEADPARPQNCDLHVLRSRCSDILPVDQFYAIFERRGVTLGPAFRAVECIVAGNHEVISDLRLSDMVGHEQNERLHPVLLDAALQTAAIACSGDARGDAEEARLDLFCGFDNLRIYRPAGSRLVCHAVKDITKPDSDSSSRASARLYNEKGILVACIDGIQFVRATRESLTADRHQPVSDLLFELTWQAHSSPAHALNRPAPSYVPALQDLRRKLQEELAQRAVAEGGMHDSARAAFDALSVRYVSRAFRELGWLPLVGTTVTTEDLLKRLEIQPMYARLSARMLEILAEEGTLESCGAGWTVTHPMPSDDVAALARQTSAQLAYHASELHLFERCASRLADVLTGRCDPLQLLFPKGSLESASRVYDDSAMAREPNALMRRLITELMAAPPSDRVLRVLEIGAGTGGTTHHIIPLLQTVPCEYVFSDVSKLFLQRAQEKYRPYSCMQYALLDIEQSPATQGFGAGQFDLIIAANVLHAARDVQKALEHVRELLAPGGMLALIEGFRPSRWIDLVFGQTEGWWRFSDHDLRPAHPLLSLDKWDRVLHEAGFADVAIQPAQLQERPAVFDQAIVMARIADTSRQDRIDDAILRALGPGTWLIFGDKSALCAELTARIVSSGNHVISICARENSIDAAADVRLVDPSNANQVAQAAAALLAAAPLPCRHAVCLWGTSLAAADTTAAAYEQTISTVTHALHAAQALIRAAVPASPKLWFATRGSQPAGGAAPDVRCAPIWGLARVLAVEEPKIYGGLIDLEAGGTSVTDAAAIFSQVAVPAGADQCAFRHGVRFVPRLIAQPDTPERVPEWSADGCYIVTGGLGGVGLHIAHWMAQQGAGRLVLISRRALPPRAEWDRIAAADPMFETVARIRAIERLGVVVKPVAVDIADEFALLQLKQSLAAEDWLPVHGVVHAATAVEGRLIPQLDRASLEASFHAKVLGASHLESCLADQPLQFYVLCSSISSLLGQAGQGSYAAANAYLDALADRRQAEGRPALGINWGGWYGAGTAATPGGKQSIHSLEQGGVRGFVPARGVAALGQLLRRKVARSVVMQMDWDTFHRVYRRGEEPPLLQRLAAAAPDPDLHAPAEKSDTEESRPCVRDQLLALAPGSARTDLLDRHLRELLAPVLKLEADEIESTKTVGSLGVDSLMAMEFTNRCECSLALSLPATLIWNYPTIAALTAYFSDKLGLGSVPEPESANAKNVPTAIAEALSTVVLDDVLGLSEEAALQALLGRRGG